MITVNDLPVWILVFGLELIILEFVIIRPQFKKKTLTSDQKFRIATIVIIGLTAQGSLISFTVLFLLQSQTDYCLAYEVTRVPINETKVLECVSKGDSTKFQFFAVSLITALIGVLIQLIHIVYDKKFSKANQ